MLVEPTSPQSTASLSHLATEAVNPATVTIDQMTPLEIVTIINAEDAGVAAAVQAVLPAIAAAIAAIADHLRQGGRLLYVGAGTSGRLGALDAIECPPTFNVSPTMIHGIIAGGSFALDMAAEDQEDSETAGAADMASRTVGSRDVVVGITASGRSPYTLGAVRHAQEQGALTIGLTNTPTSPLADHVAIAIAPVVGPEVLAGSTRMKAGTAQKMVLNMLSTGTMILLGKTYGNLMVDVQATNDKLRRRALNIVRSVTGMDDVTAAAYLDAAGGITKVAIVAAKMNLPTSEAQARLAAHDDNLRAALEGDADDTDR